MKNFAQLSASGTRPDGKACPAFKIIILDEADSMTKDAQSALRYTYYNSFVNLGFIFCRKKDFNLSELDIH